MNDNIKEILKQNCFEVFGIEPGFEIDISKLNTKLHELQKEFHPDNWINNELSTLAVSVSSHINSSYTELKNPLTRSIALLELNNHPLDLAHDTALPMEFLTEQMELHELIEDAKDDLTKLEELEQDIIRKQKILLNNLSQKFAAKDYLQALTLTKQLGFYTRLLNSIADKFNE
jgi:molecular chaperone HscB